MLNCLFKYCNKYILVVLSLNLLVACGGDGDGDGDDEECDFTYVNSAPVFTSDKVIYVQENQTVEFTINATDADGDELNFDMNGNEDGGSFKAVIASLHLHSFKAVIVSLHLHDGFAALATNSNSRAILLS